jgi:hypothetical protein
MRRGLRATLAVLSIVLAAGCQRPVVAGLPGTYVAEYEGGRDKLVIEPGGAYSHSITVGALTVVDTGRWEIDTSPGEQLSVSFAAFRFRAHDGTIKPAGVWHVDVRSRWPSDAYELCFDPDLNYCFKRTTR